MAHTAFQGGDVFRKSKGLVIESGVIGATVFTTRVTKSTKQVTMRESFFEIFFRDCFVALVSFVVNAASRCSDASQH